MWASPNDPTGSYTNITQYSDGTAVKPGDFTRSKYPSESEHWQPQFDLYGNLDYFNKASPLHSCTSLNLRANNEVKMVEIDDDVKRPVVCEGE